MRIQSSDLIVGQPALAIRKVLRSRTHIMVDTIVDTLEVDLETARQVLKDLATEGYIEASEDFEGMWRTTMQGNAVANAKAGRPITRRTADRLVEEFLVRVNEINACDDYAFRVKQVVIFGSYLSDIPTLGDVDLSIELSHRYDDPQEHESHCKARIEHALQQGRHFSTFVHELDWPEEEVRHILKGRSRGLSLHDERHERVLSRPIPSKILFPDAV